VSERRKKSANSNEMSLRVVTDTHAAELATQDDQFASSSISTCLATLSITTGLASRSAQAPRHTILFMYGLRSGRVRSLQGSYREGWDHANFESEDCHCPKNDAQLMPYYQTARLVWKIHDSYMRAELAFAAPIMERLVFARTISSMIFSLPPTISLEANA
jgi:hypothetical protein